MAMLLGPFPGTHRFWNRIFEPNFPTLCIDEHSKVDSLKVGSNPNEKCKFPIKKKHSPFIRCYNIATHFKNVGKRFPF
jgi:hypothetical protein